MPVARQITIEAGASETPAFTNCLPNHYKLSISMPAVLHQNMQFILWYTEHLFAKFLQTWCNEPEWMTVRKANNRILVILLIHVKLPVPCSIFLSVILDPRSIQIISQELQPRTDFSSHFVSGDTTVQVFRWCFHPSPFKVQSTSWSEKQETEKGWEKPFVQWPDSNFTPQNYK